MENGFSFLFFFPVLFFSPPFLFGTPDLDFCLMFFLSPYDNSIQLWAYTPYIP